MLERRKRKVGVYRVPIPWLIGVCFDCTASISDRDFRTMKEELVTFLANVHYRAHDLKGHPSDFVALTAFQGKNDIHKPGKPLGVVQMSQGPDVEALADWIGQLKNDGGSTAVYDAVEITAKRLNNIDRQLRNPRLKVVLAVTDGKDNDSRNSSSDLSFFNVTDLNLSVIEVGTSSKLRRLRRYATTTHRISGFEDLFHEISVAIRQVIEEVSIERYRYR